MHCKNVAFFYYWIIPARLITVQPFSNSDKHKLLNRQREKAWGDIFFRHHQFFFNWKAYSLLFSWFYINRTLTRSLILTIVKSCSHSLHFKFLYIFVCNHWIIFCGTVMRVTIDFFEGPNFFPVLLYRAIIFHYISYLVLTYLFASLTLIFFGKSNQFFIKKFIHI